MGPSNYALDPPIRLVTVRASARPAPSRLAGQRARWTDRRTRERQSARYERLASSQKPRGSTILRGAFVATSRRSRSPVTSTSAAPDSADANTQRSSSSRIAPPDGACGFGTTSNSRKNATMSSTLDFGSLIRFASTRASSRSTTSPVTNVCSERTRRSTSAESPRVANALTRTFVSRNTLTRRPERRLHPSGGHVPLRKAWFVAEVAQNASSSTGGGARRVPARSATYQSACRADRAASRDRSPAESSLRFSCATMYYVACRSARGRPTTR